MSKLLEILLLNIFFLMGFYSQCQIIGPNLIKNSSFEENYSCPISTGELYKSKYWWGYSTDYYNSCSMSMGVPLSGTGFQYAKEGIAFSGLILYANYFNQINYREYIKTMMVDSLKANKTYCTNFYISLAESSYNNAFYIQLDSTSILFTKVIVQDSNVLLYNNFPQINKSISSIDTTNWVKITSNFIANGGEKYLTIGNFQNTIHWPSGKIGYVYIFIDDVSVCECSFDINLGPDTTLCEGESIILSPMLPNATYTWQDSSHAATYEAKQPGTYWVRAYVADYDITTTDTIVITTGDDSYCNPPLTIPNVITPNGDNQNDNFKILNSEYYDIALQIYNRWGRLIYETANYQNDFSCRDCADGVYFYVLKAKSKRNGREKEYKESLTVING